MLTRQHVAAVATLALASCVDPTQITITLTTDAECEKVTGTSLTFGQLTQLDDTVPVTTTAACQLGGGSEATIGSIVAVPSGDDDADLAIEVVTAVGVPLEVCVPPSYAGDCIVARRALSFIPDKKLRLPIIMRDSCRGIICPEDETCVEHECRPAHLNPEECLEEAGCGEETLPPPSEPPPDEPPLVVRVTEADGVSQSPYLLWNAAAGEYALVWSDERAGPIDVWFTRMDALGEQPEAAQRQVTGLTEGASDPAIAATATGYFLSFRDDKEDSVVLRAIDRDGVLVGDILANDPGASHGIASDGNSAVQVFAHSEGVLARKLPNAQVAGAELAFDSDQTDGPISVVGTADDYAAAWVRNTGDSLEVWLGIPEAEGPGKVVPVATQLGAAIGRSLVQTSSGLALAWVDARDGVSRVYLAQFDTAGLSQGSDIALTSDQADAFEPSLVWNGAGFGLAWRQVGAGLSSVHFARFDEQGVQQGQVAMVSDGSGDAESPSLVHHSGGYGLSWVDQRHDNREIYFVAISNQ